MPAPPLDAEDTWSEHALRQAFHDDRTAPTLFPTPEDDGKEQRPYPPPPTPAAPVRTDLPAAVTSSVAGLAVATLIVLAAVGGLILWMSATAR